jgi:hypothetical protein
MTPVSAGTASQLLPGTKLMEDPEVGATFMTPVSAGTASQLLAGTKPTSPRPNVRAEGASWTRTLR